MLGFWSNSKLRRKNLKDGSKSQENNSGKNDLPFSIKPNLNKK